MTLRSLVKLVILSLILIDTSSYSSEGSLSIDLLSPQDEARIGHIKKVHYDMVLPQFSNSLPHEKQEKEQYLQTIWDNRLEDLKNKKSHFLYIRQGETSVCAIFLYPSTLTKPNNQQEEVLVYVGIVPMNKDKLLFLKAIEGIFNYSLEKFPSRSLMTYMPKDHQPYKGIIDQNGFKKVDLDGCALAPVNHLATFSPLVYDWFRREALDHLPMSLHSPNEGINEEETK